MNNQYYVYIMTNTGNKVLYTGVTNNLRMRVYEHQHGFGGGFTESMNPSWRDLSDDLFST